MAKTTKKEFSMEHIEGIFKGACETSIFYQAWIPEGEINAVLIILHGIGEHCGRYMNVVNYFIPLNYAIYGLDHVGHGKSGGDREFVRSAAARLSDNIPELEKMLITQVEKNL